MAWVAVCKGGYEYIFSVKPYRSIDNSWVADGPFYYSIRLPKGSIKKLIGRELSLNEEAVELKEE